jgi:hypothetical protein
MIGPGPFVAHQLNTKAQRAQRKIVGARSAPLSL